MIDPKELRVGATVSIGGKMQRVAAIDALNGQIGIDAYTTDAKGVKHPFGYKVEDVEPIPITEELLRELGFEIKEEFGNVSAWKKDNLIVKIIGERKVVSFVDKMHSLETCYLHELEAFVYLATKTELIKE